MSLAAQAILANMSSTAYPVPLSPIHLAKPSKYHSILPPNAKPAFPIFSFLKFSQAHTYPVCRKINASFDEPYGSSESQVDANNNSRALYSFDLDGFLSFVEFLSLASSAAISVYVARSSGVPNSVVLGSGRILLFQCLFLVSGACVGAVIRRRQWRRIGGSYEFPRGAYGYGANLLARVEKVEEDLRGSVTMIRVLSRQIEKLGIRVRAIRKALTEPISETAALAKKNSEVTRALAAQEDILEKELGEIQNVLLAMQEQQQKQLKLILAIGKAGKLLETKFMPSKGQKATETSKSTVDDAIDLEVTEIGTDSRTQRKQVGEIV